MGLSVAIAGGIVMVTIMLVMLAIPNMVSTIFSIGEVNSISSKVDDSVSKTNINVDAIITKVGSPRVNFTLTNTGSTTLWDYNNFNVLAEYTGAVSGKRTEPLSLWSANPNGQCLGVVPPAGQWCIQSILNDVASPKLINSNEQASIWTTLNENLANSVAVVTVGTDNGVTFTTINNSTSLTYYVLTSNRTNSNPAVGVYVTAFSIPLTANSGNVVEGTLVASTNTGGDAIQVRGRTDNAATNGNCFFSTPIAVVGAPEFDTIQVAAAPLDTAVAAFPFIPINAPIPIKVQCAVKTGPTPGSLFIEFQPEVAGTSTISAGSYIQKSP